MAVDVAAPGRVAVLKALVEPLVSHHLKVLRDAGIVEAERFRQWTYHRLVPDTVAAAAGSISSLAGDAPPAGERRRPCC